MGRREGKGRKLRGNLNHLSDKGSNTWRAGWEDRWECEWDRWEGRRAIRESTWDWELEIKCKNDGEERAVYRDLQTALQMIIWRSGREEKIWWRVS